MDSAANAVLGELEEVRAVITRPENIFIHMAANLDTLAALGEYSCLYVKVSVDFQFFVSVSQLSFFLMNRRQNKSDEITRQ